MLHHHTSNSTKPSRLSCGSRGQVTRQAAADAMNLNNHIEESDNKFGPISNCS